MCCNDDRCGGFGGSGIANNAASGCGGTSGSGGGGGGGDAGCGSSSTSGSGDDSAGTSGSDHRIHVDGIVNVYMLMLVYQRYTTTTGAC